ARGSGDERRIYTVHAQLRVNDRHRIAAHLAGARRMIDRPFAAPGVIQKLLIGRDGWTGLKFGLDEALHLRVRQDPPAQLESGNNRALVGLGGEVIRMDGRGVEWVRALQLDL